MNKHTICLGVLVATVLLFLIKGIGFALIGRYWPLSVGALIILLLSFGLAKGGRTSFWVIRFWASGLILWSTLRLLLGLSLLIYPKGMTENHVYEQFGWAGNLLSLLVLLAGIILWRVRVIGEGKYGANTEVLHGGTTEV